MFAKSFKDEKCYVSADCYDQDRYALSAVCWMSKTLFCHLTLRDLPSGEQKKSILEKGKMGIPLSDWWLPPSEHCAWS